MRGFVYFSPSMFLLPTSIFLLHPRFPKLCFHSLLFQVSFRLIHLSLRNAHCHTCFPGLPILFQPMRKTVSCDIISEHFISFFHSDRTLTLARSYMATRQSSSLLSLLIKTTELVCGPNSLCQKKLWAAQVVPSVLSRLQTSMFFHQ